MDFHTDAFDNDPSSSLFFSVQSDEGFQVWPSSPGWPMSPFNPVSPDARYPAHCVTTEIDASLGNLEPQPRSPVDVRLSSPLPPYATANIGGLSPHPGSSQHSNVVVPSLNALMNPSLNPSARVSKQPQVIDVSDTIEIDFSQQPELCIEFQKFIYHQGHLFLKTGSMQPQK